MAKKKRPPKPCSRCGARFERPRYDCPTCRSRAFTYRWRSGEDKPINWEPGTVPEKGVRKIATGSNRNRSIGDKETVKHNKEALMRWVLTRRERLEKAGRPVPEEERITLAG